MVRQRQRNKDGGPIRSVFYLRMSTDKQDLSIGGQRYQLLQFVESDESNDRVVVGEYIDEGISGSTSSRANFQRMMADATGPNPPFDEVITYDLSPVFQGHGGQPYLSEDSPSPRHRFSLVQR